MLPDHEIFNGECFAFPSFTASKVNCKLWAHFKGLCSTLSQHRLEVSTSADPERRPASGTLALFSPGFGRRQANPAPPNFKQRRHPQPHKLTPPLQTSSSIDNHHPANALTLSSSRGAAKRRYDLDSTDRLLPSNSCTSPAYPASYFWKFDFELPASELAEQRANPIIFSPLRGSQFPRQASPSKFDFSPSGERGDWIFFFRCAAGVRQARSFQDARNSSSAARHTRSIFSSAARCRLLQVPPKLPLSRPTQSIQYCPKRQISAANLQDPSPTTFNPSQRSKAAFKIDFKIARPANSDVTSNSPEQPRTKSVDLACNRVRTRTLETSRETGFVKVQKSNFSSQRESVKIEEKPL
ncbi:hypothetical protein R3P38DRAFT_3342601 [Favolaschia claudopus]|uniref:Uncharacterized protein n=1 Tax=Favolaschia claudopus TaxID=2862362 RepID=A0AAW0DVS0_9AGAR